jgi:hypothetical protein
LLCLLFVHYLLCMFSVCPRPVVGSSGNLTARCGGGEHAVVVAVVIGTSLPAPLFQTVFSSRVGRKGDPKSDLYIYIYIYI